MELRGLGGGETASATALAWEVFLEFEAPDYPPEGVEEFRHFLDDQEEIKKLEFFGAFEGKALLGILAMRGTHISLLFVRKEHHRKGAAKALLHYVLEQISGESITVNSSPYAENIYCKLGFVPTDTEQLTNGIRYIPMLYARE